MFWPAFANPRELQATLPPDTRKLSPGCFRAQTQEEFFCWPPCTRRILSKSKSSIGGPGAKPGAVRWHSVASSMGTSGGDSEVGATGLLYWLPIFRESSKAAISEGGASKGKAKASEAEGKGSEKSPKASPKPAGQVLAMFGGIGVSEYRARICIKLYDRALDFAGGEALI